MSVSPEGSSFFVPESERPTRDIQIDGKSYTLSWEDSSLWSIARGDGAFHHVRHIIEPGVGIIIFFSEAEPEVIEWMVQNDFPTHRLPEPDEVTLDAYTQHEARILEREINLFGSDLDGQDQADS